MVIKKAVGITQATKHDNQNCRKSPIGSNVALILSLIMLFSLNSVAHDTVQTRLDKFNENWTNVIAFKGESGKVLIQQHDWIKSCRAVILKPGRKLG
ncbi:hypothetical protein BSPWISOXPB_4320 [uncultured Gammaproteobacteria bacterium]|nr:hypothetical protein BSPWISOXPB_4320 [uncultured Gammaproteobacteria bacterium]